MVATPAPVPPAVLGQLVYFPPHLHRVGVFLQWYYIEFQARQLERVVEPHPGNYAL